MPETFNFSRALELLKEGKFVARAGWNGKDMWLGLQNPDEQSANKQPYIYIIPVGAGRVPWVASQPDMLSDDWFEVTPQE